MYLEDPASFQQSFKNSKAGFVCGIIGLCLSALFIIWLFYYVQEIFNILLINLIKYGL